MSNKSYGILRETFWVISGQLAAILGTLMLVRVLTEYLEPSEYGELALALALAGVINQVVMGGILNGIARFYPIALEAGELSYYLKASGRLVFFGVGAIFFVAVIFIGGLWLFNRDQWIALTLAIVLYTILITQISILGAIQNAARQRAIVAVHIAVDAWLKIGLALGIMLLAGIGSVQVVIGYLLSSLLLLISQFFFFKKLIVNPAKLLQSKNIKEWELKIWRFSWPFSAWGLFTWLQQISDRWALEAFGTMDDVGQYMVVFQLGYAPIGILTTLLINLISPILYQYSGEANNNSKNTSLIRISLIATHLGLIIVLVAFLFTMIMHDFLFSLFVAESYRSLSYLLPWVVLAGGLFSCGQLLALKVMSDIRPRSLLNVKITTALIGIGANYYGAMWFGIEGVVGALVFFSGIYLSWMVVISLLNPMCKEKMNK